MCILMHLLHRYIATGGKQLLLNNKRLTWFEPQKYRVNTAGGSTWVQVQTKISNQVWKHTWNWHEKFTPTIFKMHVIDLIGNKSSISFFFFYLVLFNQNIITGPSGKNNRLFSLVTYVKHLQSFGLHLKSHTQLLYTRRNTVRDKRCSNSQYS